ncbi:MAG: WXG100 family type VII secretion target [Chloroflexota bacterium]
MSEGKVEARITQLRDAAANIGTSARKIDDAVNITDQQVTSLSEDKFMSDSAEAFRTRYKQLTPALVAAYNDLMAFKTKLEESADAIEAATRV